MVGRGRGRISGLRSGDGGHGIDLSIDDLIKMGKGKKMTELGDVREERVYDVNLSIDDLIKMGKGGNTIKYNREMKGTMGTCSTQGQVPHTYKEDVFKSLDQVVGERGILPPPKSITKYGEDDLPITGGKNGRRFGTSSNTRTAKVDSTDGSLDAIISSKRNVGARFSKPVKTFLHPETGTLDPMSSSLDDVIVDRHIGEADCANHTKKRGRNDSMDIDLEDCDRSKQRRLSFLPKYIPTPYRAVSFLQEKGMIVDFKIGLKVAETKEDEDPIRKWRCIVTCGSVRGVADSARKTVARELACDEFLKNLKNDYPDGKIAHYEVPDELFLNPKVYSEIEKICEETGTNVWHEFKVGNSDGPTMFTCVYYVGEKEISGKSSDKQYAQLKAAVEVYEFLKGEPYPKTVYFTGQGCDLTVDYEFTESEVYQVVSQIKKSGDEVDPSRGLIEGKDQEEEMETLESKELSDFEESKKVEEIPRKHMPFSLPKTITLDAPGSGNADPFSDLVKPPLAPLGRGRGRGRGLVVKSFD